jgi:alkylation response protein AidB-like acyl-CoA dehydrogenase
MKSTADAGLLESVRLLTPKIRAASVDSDKTRAIAPEVIDLLRDVGVFQVFVPQSRHGVELDPLSFGEIVEELSYADGSVGWDAMIGGGLSSSAGLLPAPGVDEVFADRGSIIAGTFRPAGRARRIGGGYRVQGRWPFASGSSHADWFLCGCTIQEGDDPIMASGRPVLREMFVPVSEVEIIDTWDSTGLRGTASHDFAVVDAFVPEHRTFWFAEPPVCDRPLYWMPAIGVFASYVVAVTLGIARHALDEFYALAPVKKPTWSPAPLAEKPVVHDIVGRADVALRAGRAYLAGTVADQWDKVLNGRRPDPEDHGALWLASTHVAQSALAVIESLYTAAGAASVYATCGLDRCLRDARTAVQHVVLQTSNFEYQGRLLLGQDGSPPPWLLIDFRKE